MYVLFLFLDGVGLGSPNPEINPFCRAKTPVLNSILGGQELVLESVADGELIDSYASLRALDACLGVPGVPQSATGQSVLLTGINIPEKIGYHYGPKPNLDITRFLENGNLFNQLTQNGFSASLLNAYPPSYFSAIQTGRRMYSAIPYAVTSAGIKLKTQDDLLAAEGIAADFTAEGWLSHLKLSGTPRLTLPQAGRRLAALGQKYDFSLFEFWLSDYAGHKQDMAQACKVLESFDVVLGSLLEDWDMQEGLIVITSDHGNLEDLSTRRHTTNPVPLLLIGSPEIQSKFMHSSDDLTCITPDITQALNPAKL